MNIDVSPDQVRLQPKSSDLYRWKVEETAAHLFSKGLSKVSIGVYNQLIDGIGQSFTASLVETSECTRSYTNLEQENLRLHEQVKHWQDFSAAEGRLRIAAEQEIEILKTRIASQKKQQKKYESFLFVTGKAVRDQIMIAQRGTVLGQRVIENARSKRPCDLEIEKTRKRVCSS